MTSFEDTIMTSMYLALSNESRKILLDYQDIEYNSFHSLIGYNEDDIKPPITNENILHLCNRFMTTADCIKLVM